MTSSQQNVIFGPYGTNSPWGNAWFYFTSEMPECCLLHPVICCQWDLGVFVSVFEQNDYKTWIFYIVEKVENRFFFLFFF